MSRKRSSLRFRSRLQVIILTSTEAKADIQFIHFADTHLGLNWPPIGRREHIQIPVYGRAFASVVEAALALRVDFVIHGGDLVDRPRPPTVAWSRLLEELPKLKDASIPFIVTPGSHDKPESYFDRAGGDILGILDKKLGLVKRVDSDTEPVRLETKTGRKVIIYGLGDHGSDQQLHLEKLKGIMREGPEFKILIIHGSVTNMPNLVGPAVKSETIKELLSQGLVDYVALGHNHKRWDHRQMEIYNPGSPEYTSFADATTVRYNCSEDGTLQEDSREDGQRGYYYVEVIGEIINPRFIPLPTREVKNVQVNYVNAKASQVTEAAKEAIAKNLSRRSIIRPVFTGTLHPSTSRTEIDLREILAMREGTLYLDFPLMNFDQTGGQFQFTDTADLNVILQNYFATVSPNSAQQLTDLATKLLRVYEKKTKTSSEQALQIVDEWKPVQ
jgi:DNA repair exonuclease SbcCD nuclease subunit